MDLGEPDIDHALAYEGEDVAAPGFASTVGRPNENPEERRGLLQGNRAGGDKPRITIQRNVGMWHPLSAPFQWAGLFVISFLTFGTAVAYDSIGSLSPLLKDDLKTDASGIADLYSVYHLPNLVLVFFGGLISDQIGTRKASILCSLLVCTGVFTVATSTSLGMMLVGRFIFGMGSETLSVVQLGMLSQWYSSRSAPPSLGLACSLSLTITRLGTLTAFDVLPLIAEHKGVHAALWFVAVVGIFCLMLNFVFLYMDAMLEPYLDQPANELSSDPEIQEEGRRPEYSKGSTNTPELTFAVVWANLKSFSASYWLIVVICVCIYSALISFSDFSADFFHEAWGFTPGTASRIQSITTVIALVFTPVFGFLADKFGHRAHLMLLGLGLIVPAHFLVGFTRLYPLTAVVLQGFASAAVCSSLWPSVALVLPSSLVNTAVGLMTAIQNCALFLVPQIVGAIRVHTGDYTDSIMFYLCLDAVAIIAAYSLIGRTDNPKGVDILRLNASDIHALKQSAD